MMVYFGCLNKRVLSGAKKYSDKTDHLTFGFFWVELFFLVEKLAIRAGTKTSDNKQAINVPKAVNIPNTCIIFR